MSNQPEEESIVIIVSGLLFSKLTSINQELNRRGFRIAAFMKETSSTSSSEGNNNDNNYDNTTSSSHSAAPSTGTVTLAVKLTSILFMKISIQLDLSFEYSSTHSGDKYINTLKQQQL